MSYTEELKQSLQNEFFGGEGINTLTGIITKRYTRECKDDTLESVVMDLLDKLSAKGINPVRCFVTSREIIFTLQ